MSIDNWLFYYFGVSVELVLILFIVGLLTVFTIFSILRNYYAIYYPFLAVLWFFVFFLGVKYYYFIENTLFYDISIDIAAYFYGMIILSILLISVGVLLLVSNYKKKLTYEKVDWRECIILSPFPIALLYSAIAYRGDAFFDVPFLVFIIAVVIDKIIIIIDKHYVVHTGVKILLLLIFIKWSDTRILAQLLIVITDCMFGYVILQFISLISWIKGIKKD